MRKTEIWDTVRSPSALLPGEPGTLSRLNFHLWQYRAIRQEVSDRIFAPIQSLENEGILYVFLVFQTEEVGKKDGGDSQTQLCGVALREVYSALLLWEFLAGCFAVSEREKVKCMVSS